MQTRIAILLIAFSALPALAAAQTVQVKAAASEPAYARAAQLNKEAVSLYSDPGRASDAARLHLQEASSRSWSDPEAVHALIMAANLYNYADQPMTARKIMERAAERALAIGDVVTAAQAFTNAAFLAHKVSNASETQRLGQKAILLSGSPLLAEDERATIRGRFRGVSVFAALLK